MKDRLLCRWLLDLIKQLGSSAQDDIKPISSYYYIATQKNYLIKLCS